LPAASPCTGRSVEIYGSSTGSNAAFDVSLTSLSTGEPVNFARNASLPTGVLFAAAGLDATDETTARLVNRAGNLTIDRAVYSAPVGAEGCVGRRSCWQHAAADRAFTGRFSAANRASLTRTVLDETSPQIAYSGSWDSNSGDLFYGGSTTYTNEDGASFSFNFSGQ
jgi:hypothetical protein